MRSNYEVREFVVGKLGGREENRYGDTVGLPAVERKKNLAVLTMRERRLSSLPPPKVSRAIYGGDDPPGVFAKGKNSSSGKGRQKKDLRCHQKNRHCRGTSRRPTELI